MGRLAPAYGLGVGSIIDRLATGLEMRPGADCAAGGCFLVGCYVALSIVRVVFLWNSLWVCVLCTRCSCLTRLEAQIQVRTAEWRQPWQ